MMRKLEAKKTKKKLETIAEQKHSQQLKFGHIAVLPHFLVVAGRI